MFFFFFVMWIIFFLSIILWFCHVDKEVILQTAIEKSKDDLSFSLVSCDYFHDKYPTMIKSLLLFWINDVYVDICMYVCVCIM